MYSTALSWRFSSLLFLCFFSGGDVELGVFFGKAEDLFLPKISGVGAGAVCFGGSSVRYVFLDDAWLGETASSLRNIVLQTSLSFTGVCSSAGVGSVRICTGASVLLRHRQGAVVTRSLFLVHHGRAVADRSRRILPVFIDCGDGRCAWETIYSASSPSR